MLHVNKDASSDFLFFSAFLDLQSIRDDEVKTSKELTSRKTQVEVANSDKTMMFYESIRAYRKYPKTPDFDHSNYRLFKRIPAVPGTSNNRGLTVVSSSNNGSSNFRGSTVLSKCR